MLQTTAKSFLALIKDRTRGLTMGVLYLWITTSLVSGTMSVQETKHRIQRQQEIGWVHDWELQGSYRVGISIMCTMGSGPRSYTITVRKLVNKFTEFKPRIREHCLGKLCFTLRYFSKRSSWYQNDKQAAGDIHGPLNGQIKHTSYL